MINISKLNKDSFKEVRNDYCEHDTGLIFIDCWVDEDENSEGFTVATVSENGKVVYRYPKEDFGSTLVKEAITEAIEIQKNRKQELIDKCIEQIKKDVSEGDLTAIDELLRNLPNNYLEGYLPE